MSRFVISVNEFIAKTEGVEDAISILAQRMSVNKNGIRETLREHGKVSRSYGFTVGDITDTEHPKIKVMLDGHSYDNETEKFYFQFSKMTGEVFKVAVATEYRPVDHVIMHSTKDDEILKCKKYFYSHSSMLPNIELLSIDGTEKEYLLSDVSNLIIRDVSEMLDELVLLKDFEHLKVTEDGHTPLSNKFDKFRFIATDEKIPSYEEMLNYVHALNAENVIDVCSGSVLEEIGNTHKDSSLTTPKYFGEINSKNTLRP